MDEDDDEDVPTSHLVEPVSGQVGLILLALGTFSPPTLSHVRLLVAARDAVGVWAGQQRDAQYIVAGAYMSPVGERYDKPSAQAIGWRHRVAMCRLALHDLPWAAVTAWEAKQNAYTRSHLVVSHIAAAVAAKWPARDTRVVVVCGRDLRDAMRDPARWPPDSVAALRRKTFRFAVKDRDGDHDGLAEGEKEKEQQQQQQQQQHSDRDEDGDKEIRIDAWVGNLSSTLIREYAKRGKSIHMMTPPGVEKYITAHQLYR